MDIWDYIFGLYVFALLALTYSEYTNDYENFENNYGYYLRRYPDSFIRTHLMFAFALSVHMIEFMQIYLMGMLIILAVVNAQIEVDTKTILRFALIIFVVVIIIVFA